MPCPARTRGLRGSTFSRALEQRGRSPDVVEPERQTRGIDQRIDVTRIARQPAHVGGERVGVGGAGQRLHHLLRGERRGEQGQC